MNTKLPTTESVYEKPATAQRPWAWSIAAVIIAVVALGLACIPTLALDRPLPHPFAKAPQDKPPVKTPPTRDTSGGVVVKFKKWSISLGSKKESEKEPPEVAVEPTTVPVVAEGDKLTRDPVRWLTLAAVSLGLVGLVVASVGQLREKHTALTACAMTACAAAIAWQYLAMGIALRVAAAVCLIVLLLLASILGGIGA